jgi:hypothetical protein
VFCEAIISKAFVSRCHFDANLYSDPLATMNLLWEYNVEREFNRQRWCINNAVSYQRIRRLATTVKSLQSRVATFMNIDSSLLAIELPPKTMPHAKVTILRIIQTWVFIDGIVTYKPAPAAKEYLQDDCYSITLEGDTPKIERSHFDQILHSDRHPFHLNRHRSTLQIGKLVSDIILASRTDKSASFSDFECRALSLASDKGFCLIWIRFSDYCVLFARQNLSLNSEFKSMLANFDADIGTTFVTRFDSRKTRRGAAERSCGKWSIRQEEIPNDGIEIIEWEAFAVKIGATKNQQQPHHQISRFCKKTLTESMLLNFDWEMASNTKMRKISVDIQSSVVEKISQVDLVDLFASTDLQINKTITFAQQKLLFPITSDLCEKSKETENAACAKENASSSLSPPPVECIPEGARLISVLASGRRKDNYIMLNDSPDGGNTKEITMETVTINLDRKQTSIAMRWKRYGTEQMVFTDFNSVAASAAPLNGIDFLVCVCANTLELKGGSLRAGKCVSCYFFLVVCFFFPQLHVFYISCVLFVWVEIDGLTLLPCGEFFYFLCKAAFGLVSGYKEDDMEVFLNKSVSELCKTHASDDSEKMKSKIRDALLFNESALELGDRLECFPEKVHELIELFVGVDDSNIKIWDSLSNDPFIRKS